MTREKRTEPCPHCGNPVDTTVVPEVIVGQRTDSFRCPTCLAGLFKTELGILIKDHDEVRVPSLRSHDRGAQPIWLPLSAQLPARCLLCTRLLLCQLSSEVREVPCRAPNAGHE